jgi:hypothetical protein
MKNHTKMTVAHIFQFTEISQSFDRINGICRTEIVARKEKLWIYVEKRMSPRSFIINMLMKILITDKHNKKNLYTFDIKYENLINMQLKCILLVLSVKEKTLVF